MNGGDDVTQDFVDGVFVEDAEAAVREEIHLECFQLDAIFPGHVLNRDGAVVRETGLGADGGILGKFRGNNVAGELVGPGFEFRQFGVDAGLGVLGGVVGHVHPLLHCIVSRRILPLAEAGGLAYSCRGERSSEPARLRAQFVIPRTPGARNAGRCRIICLGWREFCRGAAGDASRGFARGLSRCTIFYMRTAGSAATSSCSGFRASTFRAMTSVLGRMFGIQALRCVRHVVPVAHRLVHAAPLEIRTDRPLEVIDERVDLLVGRAPVEPTVHVRDVAVERQIVEKINLATTTILRRLGRRP